MALQHVTDRFGTKGSSVQVNVSGGGAASLFSDAAGTTPLANPITVRANGVVDFYVTPGTYVMTESGNGTDKRTVTVGVTSPVVIDASSYGVSPANTAAQNGIAIAAMFAAVGKNGIVIDWPAGIVLTDTAIDLSGAKRVTFRGQGWGADGQVTSGEPLLPGSSQLRYTGSAARFIDARSAMFVTFQDMGIDYTNSAFTGDLIDYSCPNAATFSHDLKIIRCGIAAAKYTARSMVFLEGSACTYIRDSQIGGALAGILGRAPGGGTSTANTNMLDVSGTIISNCNYGIYNPPRQTVLSGTIFEPGTAPVSASISNGHTAAEVVKGLTLTGCGFWDMNAGTPFIYLNVEAGGSEALALVGTHVDIGQNGAVLVTFSGAGSHTGLIIHGTAFRATGTTGKLYQLLSGASASQVSLLGNSLNGNLTGP